MKFWKHKDHKGKWTGGYEKDIDNERVFTVSQKVGKSIEQFRKITFESWQMARKLGWRKCK